MVSNREPWMHVRRDDRIDAIRPASGLVSALEPVIRACSGTWIAHGAGSADRDRVDRYDRVQVPLVLRIVHCVIAGFLLKQAGLKRTTADTGAVTLIQRFGSAANLKIHLHCLVLDGVYRRTGSEPGFQEARAATVLTPALN